MNNILKNIKKQIQEFEDSNVIVSPVVGKFHKSNLSIGLFVKRELY